MKPVYFNTRAETFEYWANHSPWVDGMELKVGPVDSLYERIEKGIRAAVIQAVEQYGQFSPYIMVVNEQGYVQVVLYWFGKEWGYESVSWVVI